jgi:hypothetical protein
MKKRGRLQRWLIVLAAMLAIWLIWQIFVPALPMPLDASRVTVHQLSPAMRHARSDELSAAMARVGAQSSATMPFASTLPVYPLIQNRWDAVESKVILDAELRDEIESALDSQFTYGLFPAMCFEPGFAFTFGQGDDRVDVVVCVSCSQAYFYRGKEKKGTILSIYGGKRLQKLAERAIGHPIPPGM